MSLISPNFDHFFPNFGQGPFPKIAGKGPELEFTLLSAHKCTLLVFMANNMDPDQEQFGS